MTQEEQIRLYRLMEDPTGFSAKRYTIWIGGTSGYLSSTLPFVRNRNDWPLGDPPGSGCRHL